MTRIFLIACLFAATVVSAQQPRPTQDTRSLAERAAAMHKEKTVTTGSGSTQTLAEGANCDYKNPALGLEIKCFDDWKGVSRGNINVFKALIHSKDPIEFAMSRSDGDAILVQRESALYRMTMPQMKAKYIEECKELDPSVEIRDDSLNLNDATDTFVALRIRWSIGSIQNVELFSINGAAASITFMPVPNSADELQEMFKQARSHLVLTVPTTTQAHP